MFKCHMQLEQVRSKSKFQWGKSDYVKLKEFLDINWDDALDPSNKSVEEMWKTFKAIIRQGMDNYIPRCTGHVANRKKNFQPFNNELQ